MLFRIALRNVFRHGRRTVASAITIAVGVMFFIGMDSLYAGLDRDAIDNMVALSTAAIKVQTPAYLKDRDTLPLRDGVPDADAVSARLLTIPRVRGVAPRVRFLGEVSNGRMSMPVQGVALDPERDETVFSMREHVTGQYFTDDGGGVLIGKRLAEDLGLKLGDALTLYGRTRYESHNALELQIVGLIETTDPGINRNTAFISSRTAQELLELDGLVTELCVGLQDRVNLQDFQQDTIEAQAAITAAFPTLASESYFEQGAAFLNVAKQKRGFSMVLLGVILLIAGVGIFNTVMMSVYERIREIGVLRAHGMPPREILSMFLLEGGLIGLIGSLMGLVLGLIIVYLLIVHGIPVDKFGKDMDAGMPVWGTLHGEWNPIAMAKGMLFSIVVAVVAAWVPARHASQITVTRALRFV